MSIKIRDLQHTYASGETVALEDVNIDVKTGEMAVLIGPSGCGKTTLLNLVAGFLTASSGTIEVGDELVQGSPSSNRMVVFQDHALFAWMTIHQNIWHGMYSRRDMTEKQKRDRVEELIELVQLKGFGDSYPAQLSGGMRQRAGLARALAPEPAVLLLDEPFGALDAMTREQLQDDLRSILKSSDFTGVLVTHSIEEAAYLGDVVYIMTSRPGKISAVWRPADNGDGFVRRSSEEFAKTVAHIRAEFDTVMAASKPPVPA